MSDFEDETPQARTAESLRDDLLGHLRYMAHYWATVDGDTAEVRTTQERIEGFLHSVLVALDGLAGGFPCALDLVCRPHPDDKAFQIDEGEDWIEDGTVLNADVLLHDLLYADRRR